MKPRQVLQDLRKTPPAAGYLFLGNEQFYRDRCRQAVYKAILGDQGSEGDGPAEFDLSECPIEELIDDARTLTLFGGDRLIIGRNAEGGLPRRAGVKAVPPPELKRYFASPTPGVTIILEAGRYDWSNRDEKAKIERVAKFYAGVPYRRPRHYRAPKVSPSGSGWPSPPTP